MSTTTALLAGAGPVLVEATVPAPEPGPTEVLVQTTAWALNNADLASLTEDDSGGGSVAGYEFCGEVVEAGPEVSRASVGDRVMGTTPASFADLVVCDHRHLLPVPDEVPDEQAAASTTALVTEYGGLLAGAYEAGRSVAILGATSAIGRVGLQLARALRATTVIGTSRTADRAVGLREHGATHVVATDEQDLTQALLDATGGEGVDLVLDHVGGRVFADALGGVRRGGHVVNIGRLGGAEAAIDLDTVAFGLLTVTGVSFGFADPDQIGALTAGVREHVLHHVADGSVRPVVDSTHPRADADAAVARLRDGAFGKVVITNP